MIVVVEDPFVTSFLRSLLAKNGYRVVTAEPEHGLEMLRGHAVEADLLITNRPALFREVGARIPLLYLCAFPDRAQVASFRIAITLRKPFQPRQLLDAIGHLLADAKR